MYSSFYGGEFNQYEFKNRVDTALEKVRTILDNTRYSPLSFFSSTYICEETISNNKHTTHKHKHTTQHPPMHITCDPHHHPLVRPYTFCYLSVIFLLSFYYLFVISLCSCANITPQKPSVPCRRAPRVRGQVHPLRVPRNKHPRHLLQFFGIHWSEWQTMGTGK